MLNKKKVIMSVVLVLLLVMSLAGTVLASDIGSYYHGGFKNYFYSTDNISKDYYYDNHVDDYNYYYQRVSDNQAGTYYSRIYNGNNKASDSYMTIYSGNASSHTLCSPYYNAAAGSYVYRLKLQNGTGIKYKIAGDFTIRY